MSTKRPDVIQDEQDERWFAWCLSEWRGMPECVNVDVMPWKSVKVHFAGPDERDAFAQLVGVQITDRTKSIWYPPVDELTVVGRMRYAGVDE